MMTKALMGRLAAVMLVGATLMGASLGANAAPRGPIPRTKPAPPPANTPPVVVTPTVPVSPS